MVALQCVRVQVRRHCPVLSDPVKSIRIYAIDDVPGYRWEINWTDPYGESWSEEVSDELDLLDRFRQIVAEWSGSHDRAADCVCRQ